MENKDIIAYKLSKLYILMELYINKDSEQWRNIKDFITCLFNYILHLVNN